MASLIFLIIMDNNPINSLRIGWSLLITIIDKSYNEWRDKINSYPDFYNEEEINYVPIGHEYLLKQDQ
mgnify:CR=1 FL=1